MGVTVFECIMIVNAYDRPCEGGDLSEAHQDGLVDLSLRCDESSDKEERDAGEGEEEGSDELQITFFQVFHNALFFSLCILHFCPIIGTTYFRLLCFVFSLRIFVFFSVHFAFLSHYWDNFISSIVLCFFLCAFCIFVPLLGQYYFVYCAAWEAASLFPFFSSPYGGD